MTLTCCTLLIKSAGFIKAAWDLHSPPDSQQHSDKTDYRNPAGGIWLSCMIYLSLRTALHYAAANCNYQCLFALVGSGASVNERDVRGCSPLHYTAAADSDGRWATHTHCHSSLVKEGRVKHILHCVFYIMCSSCTYCVSKCSRSSGFFRHTENVFTVHRYCILLSFTNMK